MKKAYKTIEHLQSEITASNANLDLLSAGRGFLSDTLKILKSKYYETKKECKGYRLQNEKLKIQNVSLGKQLMLYQEVYMFLRCTIIICKT